MVDQKIIAAMRNSAAILLDALDTLRALSAKAKPADKIKAQAIRDAGTTADAYTVALKAIEGIALDDDQLAALREFTK